MRAPIVLAWVCVAAASVAADAPAKRGPCAIAIVVERASPKLDAIKLGVAEVVGSLDPRDQIAVVGYHANAQVVVPLQTVGTRRAIAVPLAAATGDGASLLAGLEAARGVMKRSKHACKRVVVITNDTAVLGVPALAGKLRGEGIAISAVGIESTNRSVLQQIARAGGGRSYVIEDAARLGSIVASEAAATTADRRLAVVFVIDRSYSMEGAALETAKELVRAGIELLDPADFVCVVAFDSEAQTFVRPQRAANRMRIAAEVARLTSGGGRNIYPGLDEARRAFDGVQGNKHVVLLSSGTLVTDGLDKLVGVMADTGFTVSTIAMTKEARPLLKQLADLGGGETLTDADFGSIAKRYAVIFSRQ